MTDTCFGTNPPIGDAPGANMTTRKHDGRGAARRGRGDDGASFVEFALISILLFTILFGIINFGLILSFRQDVTRAAAEGARGGAVAIPASVGDTATAQAAADGAVKEAVRGIGGRFNTANPCGVSGMTCTASIATCANDAGHKCVTVKVSYAYRDHPLYGNLPFVSLFNPSTVSATSVARINQ
jgi:Flp pilus assembly protein TadG